ncbi:MAG: indole-3-glycerol-phosphate synthase [Deltaproteobacteria bacterium]|nr:indole-3-glycerol-phosphate synthase [Deltaproteobacteria bacterium]
MLINPDMDKFYKAKEEEISQLIAREKDLAPLAEPPSKPDFRESLEKGHSKRGIALIAEYKRASPSLGDINLALSPQEAQEAYREADAISVLTEERYFKGSLEYLSIMGSSSPPLLRKDFIFHPLQISATALTPASAILLIVRLRTEPNFLGDMISEARAAYLTPVAEIFNPKELSVARDAGAKVIQVNSRDLGDMKVDFRGTLEFIKNNPPLKDEFFILASGIQSAADFRAARSYGYHAALVGTFLTRRGNPKDNLAALYGGL